MKSIDQIIQRQELTTAQSECVPVGEINEFARQNINAIFKRLAHTFPAFKAAYRDEAERVEVKRVWVKALVESGITSTDQIARGMAKARQSESDFFPSVGKFISWCKPDPSELGMADVHAAWSEINRHSHEVLTHPWSHPAVYEAGRRCDWFEIRNGFATQAKFKVIYQAVIDEVIQGAQFKLPVFDSSMLEHHTHGESIRTEESIQAAKQAISEMRRGL